VRPGQEPRPELLTAHKMPRAYESLFHEVLPQDWYQLSFVGPLHVRSKSDDPVAALSPPTGARTTIDYSDTDVARRSDAPLVVTADYRRAGQPRLKDATNEIPMLDVLGPDVLLWAEVTGIDQPVLENLWEKPLEDDDAEAGSMHYSTVTGQAVENDARADKRVFAVLHIRRGTFAVRLGIGDRGFSDTPESRPEHAGHLRITAPRALAQARALEPVFKRVDRQPRVTVDQIPAMAFGIGGFRDTDAAPETLYERRPNDYDYPPTPPPSGVNVFGRIRELRLAEAEGQLQVEDESRPIDAASPVEFRDVSGTGVRKGRFRVPVQISEKHAEINVTGRSDVRVNGVPVKKEEALWSRIVSERSALLLIAFVGLALAARKAGEPQPRAQARRR
jgi:hypothetical protein